MTDSATNPLRQWKFSSKTLYLTAVKIKILRDQGLGFLRPGDFKPDALPCGFDDDREGEKRTAQTLHIDKLRDLSQHLGCRGQAVGIPVRQFGYANLHLRESLHDR